MGLPKPHLHLPTWFCHFADIWLVSGCGLGISCKASASIDLRVISSNTFQQRVLEQDKSSFRRQEEKGLYRDEWARSVPSSEIVASVCWQDEHWCRLPTATTRRQIDLSFRPFQPHTLYWQQKTLPPLRKKRLLEESPRRRTLDYIVLREVVAEIERVTYQLPSVCEPCGPAAPPRCQQHRSGYRSVSPVQTHECLWKHNHKYKNQNQKNANSSTTRTSTILKVQLVHVRGLQVLVAQVVESCVSTRTSTSYTSNRTISVVCYKYKY